MTIFDKLPAFFILSWSMAVAIIEANRHDLGPSLLGLFIGFLLTSLMYEDER